MDRYRVIEPLRDNSRDAVSDFRNEQLTAAFPLSWSAYVRLLSVKKEMARGLNSKVRT